MSENEINRGRRRFLTATTAVVGAAGAGLAAIPFIQSWQPSARARVVGGPIKVNIAPLEPGQLLRETWRGQTIGILRRTEVMLQNLGEVENRLSDPDSKQDQQPAYIDNQSRALKPEYLVLVMICTHLGCIPELVSEVGPQPYDENWLGGFYCPCHKSKFDLAGRVYKGVPAPLNLKVPPYRYIDDRTVEIGVDPEQIS